MKKTQSTHGVPLLALAVVLVRAWRTDAAHFRGPNEAGSKVELNAEQALDCADGWAVARTGGEGSLFHMHISKTAGVSFRNDVLAMLPKGVGFWSHERVLDAVTRCEADGADDRVITMLREPTAHVYSQYLECAFDDGWTTRISPEHTSETYFLDNVSIWLQHFTKKRFTENDLGCYHPYNFQTRSFVASAGNGGAAEMHHQPTPTESASHAGRRAVENMKHVWFVGIVEFYTESMCLLHERLHGSLPTWCPCDGRDDGHAFSNVTHNVPKHSVSDLPQEDLHRIDALTQADRQLYASALVNFKAEVAAMEKKHNAKVMCDA